VKYLLLLLFSMSACAQETEYAYTGQAYDAAGDALTGYFEVTNPLAASTTQTITPAIEQFTISTSSPPSFSGMALTLTTNAADQIAAWSFTGGIQFPCNCSLIFTSSNTAGDNVSVVKFDTPTFSEGTSPGPGVWVDPAVKGVAAAPELDPNQMGAALALLIGWLLIAYRNPRTRAADPIHGSQRGSRYALDE